MNQYDHIQDKLKHYTVDIDKDKLWAKTSHAIPRKRRRKGFILLFSGLASLALVSLFLRWNSYPHSSISTQPSSALKDTDKLSMTDSVIMGDDVRQTERTNTGDPYALEVVTTLSNTSLRPQQNQYTWHISPSVNKHHRNQPENVAEEAIAPAHELSMEQRLISDSGSTIPMANQRDNSATTPTDPSLPTRVISDDLVLSDNTFSKESLIAYRPSPWSTAPIEDLQIHPLSDMARSSGIESVSAGIKTSDSEIPLGISLVQGVGFTTLSIEAGVDQLEDAASYISAKTKSLEQLYTSLHVFTPVSRKVQISTGLQYSRITTALHQTTTTSEDFITQGITTVIIGEDGQAENLYGDVTVHRETYMQSIRYAYHHKLDLELLLHARLYQNYRWSAGLWIKGSYNLLYHAEGTTFDTEGQLFPYSSEENPFHLKTPFGFGGGFQTTYKLSPAWAFTGRIGYERLVYTDGVFDHLLTYKHNVFNLGLGTSLAF